MSRTVNVKAPSFPEREPNAPFSWPAGVQWQVLCGDSEHYRIGIYSPAESSLAELNELELHTCSEFFTLLSGSITLVLKVDGRLVECSLLPGQAIFVDVPHNGFCPQGPHSGQALVVERDLFSTEYRQPAEW